MQAAIAMVMPAEQQAVTVPASEPVRRAMSAEALRCMSVMSTNSGAIRVIASIASGTMIEAPSAVMVPETLITGRRPSSPRGSFPFRQMVMATMLGHDLASKSRGCRRERKVFSRSWS